MVTNTRTFLRDFRALKAKARKGEPIRVRDRDGEEFLFTAAAPAKRKSLLGSAKGKITIHGDITKPTLPGSAWRPSL